MKILRLLLSTLLLLSLASFSLAADNESTERLEQFRSHMASLTSLCFRFSQKTSGQMSGRTRIASGQAYLMRAEDTAKIRWNYQLPNTQVILSDGKELRMYFEKQHQLIVSPVSALQQDITYSLFTGTADISKDFKIEQIIREHDLMAEQETDPSSPSQTTTNADQDIEGYKLTPLSPSSTTQYLTLWISKDNLLKRVTLVDNFDTRTELTFSHIEENSLKTATSKNLFQFSPPQGTEVIHQ